MSMLKVFAGRIAALQRQMQSDGADLLVVGLSSSMRYLSGFSDEPGERLFALLVPRDGDPAYVVPQIYEEQARTASGITEVFSWSDAEGPGRSLRAAIDRCARGFGPILVDDGLWSGFLLQFQRAMPQRRFDSASALIGELRMRKGTEEVECLRRAGACADAAFARVIETSFVGKTEFEIAAVLESAMLAAGADGIGFDTLVASGPSSALPHYRAGRRRIERGDVVILDYGCRIGGYCSDISRTVVCGSPSDQVRVVYEAVREAQRRAIASVRPGVPAEDVDRAARSHLAREGFGELFIHRTGHGIGLDVHESPYIVEGNRRPLEPGMAFSIEPGVYFPGRFGIRIEDVLVVTESGGTPMTAATHELQIVN